MSDDTSEPQMLLVGRSRQQRGRPRVEEPQRTVCVRLPAHRYDRIAHISLKRDESMSAIVRQIIDKFFAP